MAVVPRFLLLLLLYNAGRIVRNCKSWGGLLSTVPSLIVTTVALSDATKPGFAPQSLFKYPTLLLPPLFKYLALLPQGVWLGVLLLPVANRRWYGA